MEDSFCQDQDLLILIICLDKFSINSQSFKERKTSINEWTPYCNFSEDIFDIYNNRGLRILFKAIDTAWKMCPIDLYNDTKNWKGP